jgi:hypothetical protein
MLKLYRSRQIQLRVPNQIESMAWCSLARIVE